MILNVKTKEKEDTRELITHPKRGIELSELYSKAKDIQSKCEDYTIKEANLESMMFLSDGCKLSYTSDEGETRKSMLTRFSLGQLCNKLSVPVSYIDRCIDSGRLDLAEENLNSWIEDFGKSLLIREYNNKIRGVLSDRFSVLDTPEILEVLDDTLDEKEFYCKGYFLTPERFHARIIQREMLPVKGEDLFAGLQIDSSDVGRSTLVVKFFIFKKICTNGLIVAQEEGLLFRQKHIGIKIDEFREGLVASLSNIPALIENSINMINAARKEVIDLNTLSDEKLNNFRNNLKTQTKMPDSSISKVLHLMNDSYSFSRWGLINSITDVAKDFSLERRLELEQIAGHLLVA